jgi:hypothetical protein
MPGYLEAYGAGVAQRERLVKRLALAVVSLLVIGGVLYFVLRDYRETRQARLFLELLRKQDYSAAYRLWGCTGSAPCPDYSIQRFMEDWGPQGLHADLSAVKITRTRGCTAGVIIETDFGKGQPEYLWVERKTRNLGFAPWPVCNPRLSLPAKQSHQTQ